MICMKCIILNLYFVLLSLTSLAQDYLVVISVDSTDNHYIYVLSHKNDQNDSKTVYDGCGHYFFEPEVKSNHEICICERDKNIYSPFSIGDTVNDLITDAPSSLDFGYIYIGLGEYLLTSPNISIHYSKIENNDLTSGTDILSLKDKVEIDSYLIYIWLHQEDSQGPFFCYKDWYNSLISHPQNMILTKKKSKSLAVYYPNGSFYKRIKFSEIKRTFLIYETSKYYLVKVFLSNTAYIGLIDKIKVE